MCHQRSIARRTAFTLIELLIVVAIVATLIAILVPSLARARQQAFQVKCASNLRSIGMAIAHYVSDENGYLPFIEEFRGNWAAQIAAYVKIKRSKVESRGGLLQCPADKFPRYFHITGARAGDSATKQEKIMADTGQRPAAPAGRRTRPAGDEQSLGPLIEPVSYGGSSDRYLVAYPLPDGRRLWRTIKMGNLNRPHCQTLLSEMRGYDWRFLTDWEKWGSRQDVYSRNYAKRHYGGTSPFSNGTNWLFADGHVEWHALAGVKQLFCCQDFNLNAREALITLQNEICGTGRKASGGLRGR